MALINGGIPHRVRILLVYRKEWVGSNECSNQSDLYRIFQNIKYLTVNITIYIIAYTPCSY